MVSGTPRRATIDIVFAISHGEGGAPKWGKNRTIQIPSSCRTFARQRTAVTWHEETTGYFVQLDAGVWARESARTAHPEQLGARAS